MQIVFFLTELQVLKYGEQDSYDKAALSSSGRYNNTFNDGVNLFTVNNYIFEKKNGIALGILNATDPFRVLSTFVFKSSPHIKYII